MKLKALKPEDIGDVFLCDSFLATDIASFQELQDLITEYEEKYTGHTALITLDNLGQAEYTSGHATMAHDLDDTDGYDLSDIDPRAFEDGEHIGCLSTQSEFFIRRENFERKAQKANFSDACGRGLTLCDDELNLLQKVNEKPMEHLDRDILLRLVPVKKPYLAICAFPNGYFNCDLNPLENYAVAKHLWEKYEYRLFGVGASLLGFVRGSALKDTESLSLAVDLANLYNQDQTDRGVSRLAAQATENNYLFLKYVEYLEE